jgi:hypothetical protein
MSLWSYLWPWSEERRQRAEEERKIEERFQAQLAEARQRVGSLQAATDKIREDREQREVESRRVPAAALVTAQE